ncbi:MAG: dockerin type I domain-containing protein [Planctomycetota bacterium]
MNRRPSRRTARIHGLERLEGRMLLAGHADESVHDHEHSAGVDVAFGQYSEEEYEALERVRPDSSLSTKTPPFSQSRHAGNDTLTFVLDFKEPTQPNTSDIFGNVVSSLDVTAFGFPPSEFASLTERILEEVEEDYFDELAETVAGPLGQELAIEFRIGDIGTVPQSVTEFYFIQIGTGVSGPHASGSLGVAGVDVARDESGFGPNFGIANGDVIGSVFTDTINGLGGLQPADSLTSGFLGRTVNAIAGTTSHEVAHTISLSHTADQGSVQPTRGVPPIMGTGAIDLPNNARISDREFSLSGIDSESGNAPRQHIQQLVDALGIHPIPSGTINGTVFLDQDEDGEQDNNEPGLASVTVFADYDNDSILDANEPRALSDATGSYELTGIQRDNVILRQSGRELRPTGRDASSVVFTEFSELTPDFVEIQNLAPDAVNTAGWLIASNNGFDSDFGINTVHPFTFSLPGSMASGEMLATSDDAADTNFWGANLNFVAGTGGWLLLIDEGGRVRDSFFAGFSEEEIAGFSVTINDRAYTAADLDWIGEGVPLTYSGGSYQRVGVGDTHTRRDYVVQAPSLGTQNSGLDPSFRFQAVGRLVESVSGSALSNVDFGNVFSARQADAVFTAITSNGNRELHFLDGSTGDADVVIDLAGSVSADPRHLTRNEETDVVLFTARDASGQRELYKTDGTAEGTVLVRDLSGDVSSRPMELTEIGSGAFLFSAAMANGDRELYRTEGSFSTTELVRDLSGSVESDPRELTAVGSQVFFSATTSDGQRELYRTDGTRQGTRLVRDLAGTVSSDPQELTALGNRLFFTAMTSSGERELFSSDGTSEGTAIIKNLNGTVSAEPRELKRAGARLFFSASFGAASRELYVTDGTAAGTAVVENLPGNGNPTDLTAVRSKLYFVARATGGQRELYLSSDGSAAKLVRDLNGTIGSTPQQLTAYGNVLLFTAIRPNGNRELHRTEGTASSTAPVRDLSSGTSADPRDLAVVGDFVLFSAIGADGQREPYRTDGTSAGTARILDLSGVAVSSEPTEFVEFGNAVAASDTGTNAATPGNGDLLSGDHNDDGRITLSDVVFVINRLASTSSSPSHSTQLRVEGDTSGDGNLTPRDALLILNFLDRIETDRLRGVWDDGPSIV